MAKRRVKILKPLPGVYRKYQPEVGGVYEADYRAGKRYPYGFNTFTTCIIDVLDKRICLREGEYEVLED